MIEMILYASIIMGSQSKCVYGELQEENSLLGLRMGYCYESAICLGNNKVIQIIRILYTVGFQNNPNFR